MTDPTQNRRFEQITFPHLDAAYNLARWLARNDEDARDIVQEAYLRAFRFFGGFRGDDGRAWLLAIVRNTFYSWCERNGARTNQIEFDESVHAASSEDSGDDDPEALMLRAENVERVTQALAKLPNEFREVLVLRELEDLSYKQIATVAGVPIGTVMSRLARARKLLAATLNELVKED